MAELLELASALFAVAIYGTEERPRHWSLRCGLRLVVFAGAVYALLYLAFDFLVWPVPLFIQGLWGFALITVAMAEYYVGSKKLSLGAWAIAACLLALGLPKAFKAGRSAKSPCRRPVVKTQATGPGCSLPRFPGSLGGSPASGRARYGYLSHLCRT